MLLHFLLICLSLLSKEDVDVFLTVASTVFILPHFPQVQLEILSVHTASSKNWFSHLPDFFFSYKY